MNVEEIEQRDGIRFSWNVWPSSKSESQKLVIPIGCLYSPLHQTGLHPINYEPLLCSRSPCRAALNPYCQVDVSSKIWTCCFCLQRNTFPTQYKDISMTMLPAEVMPIYSTIDYMAPGSMRLQQQGSGASPIFFFIVDTCMDTSELQALKAALAISISLLPPKSLVGLVTFGTMVHVHELGFTEIPKSFVFKGSKDYNQIQIQEVLGLLPSSGGAGGGSTSTTNAPSSIAGRNSSIQPNPLAYRFIVPLEHCEFTLSQLIEQLQTDPWPVDGDKRPVRASGTALSISLSILETLFPNCPVRTMLFIGGACTVGPGMIVGVELKESIRSHHDIDIENVKYYKKACNFYEGLAKRAANCGHTVDILVGSLDQTGISEMRSVPNYTGGCLLMSEGFATNIFQQSCQRIFRYEDEREGALGSANKSSLNNSDSNPSHPPPNSPSSTNQKRLSMTFNGVLDVMVSKELRINGLIGPAISAQRKLQPNSISDTDIGIGGTHEWKLCGLNPNSTYGLYFEVISSGPVAPQSRAHIQFQVSYVNSSGERRLRVTTVARPLADPGAPEIALSFDQEAAAVLMARLAVYKAEHNEDNGADILRWLDRLLIRICQKYGDYRREDPSSFRLGEHFSLYPQFMFHLRRSQFLHVFNNSPDETAFYRHTLNKESTINSLIMIQPTLISYALNQPPQPVLLDSLSIRPDAILFLDSYFHLVLFHGSHIAQWRDQEYHLKAEYSNLKALLEAPPADASEILNERLPIPIFVVCDQGGSQARFLISKLNPSMTHVSQQPSSSSMGGGYGQALPGISAQQSSSGVGVGMQSSQAIFTDDVSLQVFLDHLKKLAVTATV